MAGSLGLFVSSDQHLDKIIGLCRAAQKKGVKVTAFFTHRGTLLTQDPLFEDLYDLAEIVLCKMAFEGHGLDKTSVPRIPEKGFATQAVHAEMIEDCDRCVVF